MRAVLLQEVTCGVISQAICLILFLADRTIGRAFATACRLTRLSVCLSVVCRLSVCDVLYPGKTAGPICMKFSGKVWTDHGTT